MSTAQGRLERWNLGFLLLSFVLAWALPFQVFLFAYAVLGPAHYLTEISWLHERNYFSPRRTDGLWLGLLAVVVFCAWFVFPRWVLAPGHTHSAALNLTAVGAIYAAFGGALIAVLTPSWTSRAALWVFLAFGFLGARELPKIFTVFLPTMIHVLGFTGVFMWVGARRTKHPLAFLSLALLAVAPIGLWLLPATAPLSLPTETVTEKYDLFLSVPTELLRVLDSLPEDRWDTPLDVVYSTPEGRRIARVIAFAYTYHYLNWFVKTSVIRWHDVPRWRLALTALLWLLSLAAYAWNYRFGFELLFFLSYLHVFLEFPLNHKSFLESFKSGVLPPTKSRAPVRGSVPAADL